MASSSQSSSSAAVYKSDDGIVTTARVRFQQIAKWLRQHDYYRGVLLGVAAGLVLGLLISSVGKQALIMREADLEGKLVEERNTLRDALKKAVDKVREAEQRASRAIEHANQQMHSTAQRAIDMQGEVNLHINRVHEARGEAAKHQQDSMKHQQIAAAHAQSLKETSEHLQAVKAELQNVEEAEVSWEKFHRAAIEKTLKHGDHKAFPHMILNAEEKTSTGFRVGQKKAVTLNHGRLLR